jgi:hypothetical protein
MRHALEQQKLLVTWQERRTPRGLISRGEGSHGQQFQLSIAVTNFRTWEVEFKTGKLGKLRRKTADCNEGLTKAKGFQLARRILQRVTQKEA